ncbi:MAG: hypothetical protein LBK63_05785 [Treponema sp.]|jgi:hypothetical protein|nr:hypothetical protein [Treponema sp.]
MKKYIFPLFASMLMFCGFPSFVPAQTGEERIETGRFGAEEPEAPNISTDEGPYRNHRLYLGLRAGPSLGIYIPGDDTAFTGGDSYGASLNAAFQAAVEIVPLFSVQAEALFAWDHGSLWQYEYIVDDHDLTSYQLKFRAPLLQCPLLARLNFYPGKFRVSPFAGAYVILALGKMEIDNRDKETSYDYSYSLPLGLLGGLNVAFPLGPGLLFVDIRYAADLSNPELQGGDLETYTRHTAVLSLGYEFGLFKKR